MRAGGYHLSNPSAARLAAVHESTSRIISIRVICAVMLLGWLFFVGSMAADGARVLSDSLRRSASDIKISVQ